MATVTTDRRRGINASTAIKKPCVCATTANITLSGEQTIDGITTAETRVLVKDQTDASENGIYLSDSSAWTREPDWDGDYDVSEGTLVFVSRGTVNAQTLWRIATTGDITVGTTNVTISQQSLSATAILSDGSVKMAADFDPATDASNDLGNAGDFEWRDLNLSRDADVGRHVLVGGNLKLSKGADIASAGALTLGADGNYFDITGTNTITSLSSLGIGTVVTLHFDGALTLTHNATDLVLPGAGNITTAAGDEATFVEYAAGDWRCINYQRADGNIKFPATQSASSDVNTLDDYEEGTFTPTIQDTSASDAEGQTYSTNTGYYTKVGNVVHIWGEVNLTSYGTLTTSAQTRVANLPFTAANNTSGRGGLMISYAAATGAFTAGQGPHGEIVPNTNYALLYKWSGSAASPAQGYLISDLGTGGQIYFSATYMV